MSSSDSYRMGGTYSTVGSRSRSTENRLGRAINKDSGWLLGVCANIARILRIDPAIVRVVAVVALLFQPIVVIACYLILWVIFFRSE